MLKEKSKSEQRPRQVKSMPKLPKKSADTLDSVIDNSDEESIEGEQKDKTPVDMKNILGYLN